MSRQLFAKVAVVVLAGGLLVLTGPAAPVVIADPPTASGAGGAGTAAATGPEAVFKDKGLTKEGFFLVVDDETKLHDSARDVRELKMKVASEALDRANIARAIDTSGSILTKFETQLATLHRELDQLRNNPDQYNQLVGPYNETLAKAKERYKTLQTLQKRMAGVEDSQTEYSDAAIAASKQADALTGEYAKLADDADLKSAIASFNTSATEALKLGPSGTAISDSTFVKKCATDIIAQGIPVQMNGNVPLVRAIINGKKVVMVWDSGASFVCLSAKTAADLGITVKPDDPTLETTVADGRKVESRLVTVPSIQLGPFIVDNVKVLVDPAGGAQSPDLLGGTFQNHFLAKLDAEAGVLHLTPSDKSAHMGEVPADQTAAANPGDAAAAGGDNGSANNAGGAGADATPSPFARKPRDLMDALTGKFTSHDGGIYTLDQGDMITTKQRFTPPVAFRIIAKTDSTNLKITYAADDITFNWEKDMKQLRIEGGPADGRNKAGAGKIPLDTFVTIDLVVLNDSMTISVDGKQRYHTDADFSKIHQALSIWQDGSATIQVKSIQEGVPNQ